MVASLHGSFLRRQPPYDGSFLTTGRFPDRNPDPNQELMRLYSHAQDAWQEVALVLGGGSDGGGDGGSSASDCVVITSQS